MEQQFIDQARGFRNRAGYIVFDTVWIGRGATAFDQNFYEDFQSAATEAKLTLFAGRKSPQDAWTNRRDRDDDALSCSWSRDEQSGRRRLFAGAVEPG
jgi:hypothetical protein